MCTCIKAAGTPISSPKPSALWGVPQTQHPQNPGDPLVQPPQPREGNGVGCAQDHSELNGRRALPCAPVPSCSFPCPCPHRVFVLQFCLLHLLSLWPPDDLRTQVFPAFPTDRAIRAGMGEETLHAAPPPDSPDDSQDAPNLGRKTVLKHGTDSR